MNNMKLRDVLYFRGLGLPENSPHVGRLRRSVASAVMVVLIFTLISGAASAFEDAADADDDLSDLEYEGPPDSPRRYSIEDLGTLGGSTSYAHCINNSGEVVGRSYPSSGAARAFLYSAGHMLDLGTLGGTESNPSGVSSLANGINDAGEIVGWSATSSGAYHAFRHSGGQTLDLGTLGGNSGANQINDSGKIVGNYYRWSGTAWHLRAFLYTAGQMLDLGTFGGASSNPKDINGSGQIVGRSETASGADRAFLYADGQMRNLGTLGGDASAASAINESGLIVGSSHTVSGAERAFVYSGSQMRDLGTLGGVSSNAQDINDFGQIVGWSSTSTGAFHPFFFANDRMLDLTELIPADSGWVLDSVGGINNHGQIVGTGLHNGVWRAFLLTPGVQLLGAVSRKTHDRIGSLDVNLPLTGNPGVESRTGGAGSNHTVIFTFSSPLESVGGAVVESVTGNAASGSTGVVSSSAIDSDAHQYVVHLNEVADAQDVTIKLLNVTDAEGNTSSVVVVRMGVLLGDSNNDGTVNSGDALQTRNRSGQSTDKINFRSDFNLDGSINTGDAFIVRSRSGNSIP